jgi:hypothetical protein
MSLGPDGGLLCTSRWSPLLALCGPIEAPSPVESVQLCTTGSRSSSSPVRVLIRL